MYRCALSFGKETTYGTAVATTHAVEFIDESFDLPDLDVEGEGFRSGDTVPRDGNVTRPVVSSTGGLSMQPTSKGMGLLLEWLMGAGSPALVGGTTWQQNFTLADLAPSQTVQKQLPRRNQTLDVQQYKGSLVTSFEISMDAKGVLKLTIDCDNRDVAVGGTADALVYVVGTRFAFAGGSFGTGAFTAPTPTTLATAATPVAGVRSWSMKVDRKLDVDAPYNGNNSGLKDQPLPNALCEITMTAELELVDGAYAAAVRAGTPQSFVANFTAEALSVGLASIQIAIPRLRPKGPLPKAAQGVITTSATYKVYSDGTSTQPMWICTRTSDAALA